MTPYHSRYWAEALTLEGAYGSLDKLSQSIGQARVDLNPHQVDAALFALRSPFSKGVILADEVGLGKTIEAGIVVAQRWAEGKRRILLVLPATLRKQWQGELLEKFGLPSVILETKNYNSFRKEGAGNPFAQPHIVICSYNFVASKARDVGALAWDLLVIDEAHRLRNVYKPSNKTAKAIRDATGRAPKLLLTATPLQNSLLELYGLVSVVDAHVFGSLPSFREQFLGSGDDARRNALLRQRLQPLCKRTLRKQVLEYIRFTRRIPLTQEFLPTDEEQRLYEEVSDYLQRQTLMALPSSQRQLMTLVLRKLLASSSFAIAATLRGLVARLTGMRQEMADEAGDEEGVGEELSDNFEAYEALRDEWTDEESAPETSERMLLEEELTALHGYADLAQSISENAKGQALLTVLERAFEQTAALGGARKAVIFTESRRTQEYLLALLSDNGYAGEIALMNGSNSDPISRAIYERWQAKHRGSSTPSGSRTADTKASIVEAFRDDATLLIATESAAEGVNLQFCSLVINYDLPWNPQRVEQRIGRCHRYGQQHDVVVVNFLNKRNAADQRVYQLLAEKFKLFEGVFGSSDEVLGALASGVDLEKRIAEVYNTCRNAAEIQAAFDALQAELETRIETRLAQTRQALLENVDEEVSARLNAYRETARAALSQRERWLLDLTRAELGEAASFSADAPRFSYGGTRYNLDWKAAEKEQDVFYNASEALADSLIRRAASRRDLPTQELRFDYSGYGGIIGALKGTIEPLVLTQA